MVFPPHYRQDSEESGNFFHSRPGIEGSQQWSGNLSERKHKVCQEKSQILEDLFLFVLKH